MSLLFAVFASKQMFLMFKVDSQVILGFLANFPTQASVQTLRVARANIKSLRSLKNVT